MQPNYKLWHVVVFCHCTSPCLSSSVTHHPSSVHTAPKPFPQSDLGQLLPWAPKGSWTTLTSCKGRAQPGIGVPRGISVNETDLPKRKLKAQNWAKKVLRIISINFGNCYWDNTCKSYITHGPSSHNALFGDQS